MLAGVLCCGNVVMDTLVRPVEHFVWNTTTWVETIEQEMGGNGANTAFTLASLGAPVRLLSAVGSDATGEQLLRKLRDVGVDVSWVHRSSHPTATTVALVNAAGDRLFLHRPGASAELFAEPIEFTPPLVRGMSHFHLGNLFALPRMRHTAAESVRRARAAGLTTSIDAGWDSQERWIQDLGPCLPHADLLFVNEEEAQKLGGAPDAAVAARTLRELGARTVVVKLGGAGCSVFAPYQEFRVPAFDVPVVDTTGAGDCFAGAFLAALHRGRLLPEAARFANAAAALSVQALGATAGLRSFQEIDDWMKTAPLRSRLGVPGRHSG